MTQEVFGELHSLIYGEVQAAVADVFLNPARKLPTLVSPSVTLRRTKVGDSAIFKLREMNH